MSRWLILAPAAALITACSGDALLKSSTIVRDSAGVQIVETAGDVWSTPSRWVIAEEPIVRIGAAEGDDAYLFSGVRGIAALSDGRFVVANAGDQSLRWYDAEGRFLFRRGGPGQGPGEFSQLGPITALRVMETGEDRIFGQLQDDLGIETVAVYALDGVRPGR